MFFPHDLLTLLLNITATPILIDQTIQHTSHCSLLIFPLRYFQLLLLIFYCDFICSTLIQDMNKQSRSNVLVHRNFNNVIAQRG